MPVHFAIPTDYTDAEMLALTRQAIAEVLACGQSHALPGNREWKGADLAALEKIESRYASRVESSSGRAVNYVRMSR